MARFKEKESLWPRKLSPFTLYNVCSKGQESCLSQHPRNLTGFQVPIPGTSLWFTGNIIRTGMIRTRPFICICYVNNLHSLHHYPFCPPCKGGPCLPFHRLGGALRETEPSPRYTVSGHRSGIQIQDRVLSVICFSLQNPESSPRTS